ncbi:hypothetical protein HMPREF2628_08755 [Streptococcus sp. HMSC063B03]|uniref:hypothetical protein n=1 Tax=Streptococcus sp. HMSC063B03 TaxID=1715107 RepID=UPI0008A994BB|nr:hypothetical protein [Streptococcus sp. HMSC063B03]OHP85870.1 hypothetical protein HMPREF2628_08755 [Streptococcus sp. HMSC063B03]
MSKHTDFILTPITTILEEAVAATSSIGDGIETYPLCDYILQATFLKMTGFQEQKMRCIAWELGTNDFEFRYWWLEKANLGTYSAYDHKNNIYKEFYQVLKRINIDFSITDINKKSLLDNTTHKINEIFKDSNLISWVRADFSYFVSDDWTDIDQFLKDGNNMFVSIPNENNRPKKPERKEKDSDQAYEDKLREYNSKYTIYIKNKEHNLRCKYEIMFNQRNRLAHNTLSYQQNLPTLNKLVNETQESRNYFIWFGLLTLIDNIFIELYRLYQDGLEDKLDY